MGNKTDRLAEAVTAAHASFKADLTPEEAARVCDILRRSSVWHLTKRCANDEPLFCLMASAADVAFIGST
jgi:hypothetical protein